MSNDSTLLIRDATIVTMDPRRRIIEGGSVLVRGGRIAAVGEATDLGSPEVAEVIDGRDKVVLPGLIDLHFHSFLTRGVSDDLPVDRWVLEVIYPQLRALEPSEARIGALLSYAEAIKCGTTCVNDMSRHMHAVAEAAGTIGIRAELSCFVADESEGLETIETNQRLVEQWHGAERGRIRTRFGIEWLAICSAELLAETRRRADRYGVGLHVHLSESQGEVELTVSRHGARPVELAARLDLLGPDLVAAHCVWLTGEEIELLRRSGTMVSHNPVSNAKLGSGVAPVPELRAAGVTVGLGHDAAVCNNSRDMFEVMKWSSLLHRASRSDASLISAEQALEMATIEGARALGLEHEIGSIEQGKKADLILVDLTGLRMVPYVPGRRGNLLSNLIYAAHGDDVNTVIIDGRVVLRDRELQTLREADLRQQANVAARQLLDRIASGAT